jgi:hypothetical protein
MTIHFVTALEDHFYSAPSLLERYSEVVATINERMVCIFLLKIIK